MHGEFNINTTTKPQYVEVLPKDRTLRRLTKAESLALKSRIGLLKQQREVELSATEPLEGEMVVTVLPAQKGWVDKKDHRKERGDRTNLESRAVYRWGSDNKILKTQERIAMGR